MRLDNHNDAEADLKPGQARLADQEREASTGERSAQGKRRCVDGQLAEIRRGVKGQMAALRAEARAESQ